MSVSAFALQDGLAMTKRNLLHYVRVPQMLVFSSIQPIMFVLLFRYVFGGAIPVPGLSYVDFLMPGIFVQTVIFGAMNTGIGLATDMGTGVVERFRSLPMARSAVLFGRTAADLVRNIFVTLIMTVVGVLVGFRPDSVLGFLGGTALMLLFAYAFSWVVAIIGLTAKNAESAQAAVFPLIFPLTFASSAFVPTETMPGWLQAFAVNQPISQVINSVRHLMVGVPKDVNIFVAIAWIVGIFAVFAPLAVRKYRNS